MPIGAEKCPMFPHFGRNAHCVPRCEVPVDMMRMSCAPFVRMFEVPIKPRVVKKCDNPCAPKDSLDLALSACYDHHAQWWAPKASTRMQCETYRLFPYGRCQARLRRLQCLPDDPCSRQCPQPTTQRQCSVGNKRYRNENSHLDCTIASPHANVADFANN